MAPHGSRLQVHHQPRAYKDITNRASPNQNARNRKITGITIHWWGKPTGQNPEGIVSWLCDKRAGTSAHYVVSEGTVWCIVDPDRRAWHAGSSAANHSQIGIELDPNASPRAATEETAAALIADLRAVYGDLPLSPSPPEVDVDGVPGRLGPGPSGPARAREGDPVSSYGWLVGAGAVQAGRVREAGRGRAVGTATTSALQRFLNAKVKAGLKVDGRTGPATWKALQRFLGHPVVDGVIEQQSYRHTELGNGISPNGWIFSGRKSKGSKTMRRLQKLVGVSQDGVVYEGTTKALRWLNVQ